MPFVGQAFLQQKIPLDPRNDFDDSIQCKFCELLNGHIFKFYPEEFLEEHPNRASFFIREYLPGKNEDLITYDVSKMQDPDYIDPYTGKKNNASGYQDAPTKNHEFQKLGTSDGMNVFNNMYLRNHMKHATDVKDINKQGSRLRWEK